MFDGYLVGLELGVIQLLDGVLHVLVADELADAGAVLENLFEQELLTAPTF